MSTDRDVTRIVRSWLDEGVTQLPDRVLDAVLDQVPATSQRRAWWPAWRFLTVNATLRYGIAAVVVAVAAIVGFSLINNQVGDTEPTPTPSSSAEAGAAVSAALLHPFLGEPREAALAIGGDRSMLIFTESTFALETGSGEIFRSAASVADSDVLVLVAQGPSSGCEVGTEGRYPYSFSPGGSILTFTEATDPCAERAAALSGDWQRSDCRNAENACLGNLEAGTYASQFIEPRALGAAWKARYGALTYTVPAGWAAFSDWPETYGLMTQADYATYDAEACADCADQIAIWVNPQAASLDDCAEAAATGVDTTVAAMVEWLTQHPGLVVSEPQEVSIGGLNGTIVDLEMASDWTETCPAPVDPWVAAPTFFNGWHLAIAAGDRQRFVLVDLGDGNTVAINLDARDSTTFDAFVAEAMPIVETFEFPPR
jgi:hypothetical protein